MSLYANRAFFLIRPDERNYKFNFKFFGEIIPEVSLLTPCLLSQLLIPLFFIIRNQAKSSPPVPYNLSSAKKNKNKSTGLVLQKRRSCHT